VVPALIILALWVALLGPGVVRWLRTHTPSTSIASFHRQLRGLEHTGPKLMEPAYRLEGEDERLTEWVAPAPPPVVPRLVLLPSGVPPKEPTMRHHRQDDYDERYDDRFDDPYGDADVAAPAWDDPWGRAEPAPEPVARTRRTIRSPRYEYDDELAFDDEVPVPVLSVTRAKARRTRILAGLGAAVIVSFVFGLLPGLTILWSITLISVVALIAYLCLWFYASNAGMFGSDDLARVTPVARSVVTPYADRRGRYDDEGWEPERVAVAR
jgi:hypothetical protein